MSKVFIPSGEFTQHLYTVSVGAGACREWYGEEVSICIDDRLHR